MLLARLEKRGKYVDSWSGRDVLFNTETGMLYATGKETGIHVMWRHKMKVMRIIAKANVVDIDYRSLHFDVRDIFSFKLEGSARHLDSSFASHLDLPTDDRAVVKPFPANYRTDESEGSAGEAIVWYMCAKTQTDFMCIYGTIRDFLIRDGMRPPQFWGLPKLDPRFDLPLAEPPLYLWHAFRAVKQSVFYACVHGRMARRGADVSAPLTSLTLLEDSLYLTLFDKSVVVFDEKRHVLAGIPITEIKALHYATLDVAESLEDPENERGQCFLAFTTDNEQYSDILFLPTLDLFAEANKENVPAAQVNRVRKALTKLSPATEVGDVRNAVARLENDTTSAANGLLNAYARAAWERRPLRLPEMPAKGCEKEISDKLILSLPPPCRLSELAAELGIQMKPTPTGYPHSSEYFSSETTVNDPTHRKKTNPLHDLFMYYYVF